MYNCTYNMFGGVNMMIWVIDTKGFETKEMIKKYAKKLGYQIIDEIEIKKYHQIKFKLEKRKVGQPRKNISKEEILILREKGNSIKDICKVLNVSRATVYNYLK